MPWVSIGDMTRSKRVIDTERRVSSKGIDNKRLPIGQAGTVLFAMYASVGAIAELGGEATWNQAILGITPRSTRSDSRFVSYWLEHLRPQLSALIRSNTQDNLNAEQVGNFPFPTIGIGHQRAIADYLDAETARIDALIEKRRRMIHLLRERLDTRIRHELLSLGCPTLPLKRRWTVVDCKHRTPEYIDDGIPVVSPGDTTPGRLELRRAHRFVSQIDYADLAEPPRQPTRGDIVYSRNASIGIASYVDTEEPFCMGQDVCLITSLNEDQLYLTYVLNTLGIDQLEREKVGSTFSRVNIAQIVEIGVPVPGPKVQRSLAHQFDKWVEQCSSLTDALRAQLAVLVERRQALITAAVTGELEIPEAAA